MKHVPGKKYNAADGPSSKGATAKKKKKNADDEDIEDFVNAQLWYIEQGSTNILLQFRIHSNRVELTCCSFYRDIFASDRPVHEWRRKGKRAEYDADH